MPETASEHAAVHPNALPRTNPSPPIEFLERHYLALQRLPQLGPRREARLFQRFPSLAALLHANESLWRAARLHGETIAALRCIRTNGPLSPWLQAVEAREALCAEKGWRLMCLEHQDYPRLLLEIAQPPPLLFVWGDASLLSAHQVAIVGSRKATGSGLRAATSIATDLAKAGMVVCSGMALGIDSASHRAVLAAGKPTIAVMGSGLQRIYPARNRGLASEIANSGCVVTEFPPDTAPQAGNFPQRNRIISGLSRAVVVVEAAKRSGSLITARYALEQNREVFAVPGSINNAYSNGCNELIKSGASLLSCADDVLQQLQLQLVSPPNDRQPEQLLADLSPTERQLTTRLATVLHHVGFEPTSMGDIIDACALPAATVAATIMELQLLGRVEQSGASYLRIR